MGPRYHDEVAHNATSMPCQANFHKVTRPRLWQVSEFVLL